LILAEGGGGGGGGDGGAAGICAENCLTAEAKGIMAVIKANMPAIPRIISPIITIHNE
jgi:hypothetical protein